MLRTDHTRVHAVVDLENVDRRVAEAGPGPTVLRTHEKELVLQAHDRELRVVVQAEGMLGQSSHLPREVVGGQGFEAGEPAAC